MALLRSHVASALLLGGRLAKDLENANYRLHTRAKDKKRVYADSDSLGIIEHKPPPCRDTQIMLTR